MADNMNASQPVPAGDAPIPPQAPPISVSSNPPGNPVVEAARLEGQKLKTNLMNMPLASVLIVGLAAIGLFNFVRYLSASRVRVGS